jgi:hypothetical protein
MLLMPRARSDCARILLAFLVVLALASRARAQAEEDTTAPTVQVVSLAANDIVRGVIKIEVAAVDELGGSGVARVELLVNQHPFGFVESPSNRVFFEWNTLYVSDGPTDISARAVDAAGNSVESPAVRVVVDNLCVALTRVVSPSEVPLDPKKPPDDTVKPWVIMTSPVTGTSASGSVHLEAYAVDNSAESGGTGVASVEFWQVAKGKARQSVGKGTAAPDGRFDVNWATAAKDDGDLQITAVAKDGAGNESESSPIRLRVDSVPPELHPIAYLLAVGNKQPVPVPIDVWTSPPVLHDGDVTVLITFAKPGKNYTAMDVRVRPTVTLTLPGGGARLPVIQTAYYGERGLWIGTVRVNREMNGAGTAVITVSGAKDVAGNTMADNNRAGFIELVEANPAWPVPHHEVMTDVGMVYKINKPETQKFRAHEGDDLYEDYKRQVPVKAIRAGKVSYVEPIKVEDAEEDEGNENRPVTVAVVVGSDASGKPILQYDSYLHLTDVAVSKGDGVAVGSTLGYISSYYKEASHTHIDYGYEMSGLHKLAHTKRYVFPLLNSLFLFGSAADRDPGSNSPRLFPPPPERSIFTFSYSGGNLIDTPNKPVYGKINLLGSFSDHMGYYAESFPLEVGYWIRPQQTVARRMRTAQAPYLLCNWIQYDVTLDDQSQLIPYVALNDGSAQQWERPVLNKPIEVFRWTRYHRAVLSNAGGLNGDEADRQMVPKQSSPQFAQFWATNAQLGSGTRDNGSDAAAAARVNSEALFPDGRYKVQVVASDLGQRLRNVGDLDVVVDNFAPHVLRVRIEQGLERTRLKYAAGWELNKAGKAQELVPPLPDERNPGWVNTKADVVITAEFSEPLREPPTLLIRKNNGNKPKTITMDAAPATRATVWQARILANDPDLTSHVLDHPGGSAPENIAFAGQDLAGNDLDTNPATIAGRDPGKGTFTAAYEHSKSSDWDNRVADHSYKVRIDTRHDRKPEPLKTLEPGK